MAETEIQGDASGLPGELVRQVAERIREANVDLERYGYQLALVPEEDDAADGAVPVPEAVGVPVTVPEGAVDGHWSEVEVEKLANDDLRIRLRGFTRGDGSDRDERMARLVRALLRETLF